MPTRQRSLLTTAIMLWLWVSHSLGGEISNWFGTASGSDYCDCSHLQWSQLRGPNSMLRCGFHCWSQGCPRWPDEPPFPLSARVFDLLSQRLFGQPQAIEEIVKAFRARPSDKPLILHFAGDNGVGKTYAGHLIAKAIFQMPEQYRGYQKGELYIRGSIYRSTNVTEIAGFRTEIRNRILNYLMRCPEALIIMDEVEVVSRKTMAVFEDFLVATIPVLEHGTLRARLDKATFIFTSDFGREGITKNKTLSDIQAKIKQECDELWTGTRMASMMDHIVPFVPVSYEGVKSMVEYSVANLHKDSRFSSWSSLMIVSKIVVESNVITRISEMIWAEMNTPLYENDNYRAVEKLFRMEVFEPALRVFESKCQLIMVSRDQTQAWVPPTVDVHISIDEATDKLAVQLVEQQSVEVVTKPASKDEL